MVNDRARRRVVQFGNSDPPPAEPTSGVEVVVDGFRVTDVLVREDWQETVGADGLGEALRTAANDAMAATLVAQLDDPEPEAAVRVTGAAPAHGTTGELVGEVRELLALFDRDLARYQQELRDSVITTACERGVNGKIEVSMSPGHVTEVAVDRFWARNARYTEVRAEALSAFQAADRSLGARDPRTVELPASLARLQQIAGDPAALRRRLGFS